MVGVTKYSKQIRYGLFFITLFLMVSSIKIVLNDANIEKNIKNTIQEKDNVMQATNFNENFVKSYIQSDYKVFFSNHENMKTQSGEYIIKFNKINNSAESNKEESITNIKQKETIVNISTPQNAWIYFVSNKYNKFLEKIKK